MTTKNVLILATISYDESTENVDGFIVESLQRGMAEKPQFKATCVDAKLMPFPHPITVINEFKNCPYSAPF